jgi:hypothetical protein
MVPADFDTADCQERLMNIVTFLITNTKTPILMQPGKTAFYHPAIDAQSASIFVPSFSHQGDNSSAAKLSAMRLRIISPITKNAIGMLKRSADLACDCRNTVNQRQKLCDVVTVCTGQYRRKRDTIGVCYQMVFRPFLAAIRRIWACFCPPKTARTDDESTTAREKSIWSACRNLFSITRCILSHTPAFCHSCSRRQQVIPQPQPISCGRSSHPMPVFNTNNIPVRAWRFDTGFRPGYRNLRFFSGINGFMISHNSSLTIGFAMSSILAFLCNIQLLMLSVINVKYISFC